MKRSSDHPAYFAVVMATGIVSIASHFLLFERIALGLFWLNILFYAVLWVLTLLRLTLHPVRMWEDLQDFKRGVGYLTTVAGTCVLGSQFILLADATFTAAILLVIGTALWLFFIYGVLDIPKVGRSHAFRLPVPFFHRWAAVRDDDNAHLLPPDFLRCRTG
ncbi:MAG: hypothetical protein P8182_05815 [Deltaproteobacteria bacterium]